MAREDVCLLTHDKVLCDSIVCKGYAWCLICDACLKDEDALKDEL